MIIKYVLNGDGTIPDYVENGGVFMDPDDATEATIGKAAPSGIPSDAPYTTVSISKTDLTARVQSIMDAHPIGDISGENVAAGIGRTATEIVDAWCIQVGEV